jgi:hypothetical protein
VQHRRDVDVQLTLQLIGACGEQGAGRRQAGVVDQQVDRRDIGVGEPRRDLVPACGQREIGRCRTSPR